MKKFSIIAITLALLLLLGALFLSIGLWKPVVYYQTKVLVNAPTDKAFALFMDTNQMSKWITGFQRFELLSGVATQPGCVHKMLIIQQGKTYVMTEKLTAFKPNALYAFVLDNEVLTDEVDIHFTAKGNATEITANNKVVGKNLFWHSLFPLTTGIFIKQSQHDYEQLKVLIEKTPFSTYETRSSSAM